MKKKLFISFLIPVFVIVSLLMGIEVLLSFRAYDIQLNNDLKSVVSLIEIDKKNGASTENVINKYGVFGKISFIQKDGKLINSFDNTIDRNSNQLSRKEVKDALKHGEGSSIGYQDENKQFNFYKAFSLTNEFIIINIPMLTFSQLIVSILWYGTLIIILTVGISGILSYFFFKRNIEPMMILERYIRRTYKHKTIAEVGIQSLPAELKNIADIFKETTKSLEDYANKEEEQKLYLFSTINTMEDGFIAIDDLHNIRLINSSAKSIFNMVEDNIVGSNLIVQTQNFELNDAVDKTSDYLTVQEIVINEKIYKLTIYPLESHKGKLIILNDITKLNKLENMRKEFVSNVSHELKTPLTAIRGFVETLKDGAIDDPATANKFLGIIDIESQRLEMLISDLLRLSSIESNKVDRLHEDVNINTIADDAVETFSKMANKKKVVIENKLNEICNIKGNKELFKALIFNLVSNAIKYNKENGTVDINCICKKDYIVIEVSDTGIGIGKDDLDRIFERFYKVDKSRSYDPESTGLGLSIVKHIVELFGGDISVDSKLGEGTIFKVVLPKKEV